MHSLNWIAVAVLLVFRPSIFPLETLIAATHETICADIEVAVQW